MLSTENIPTTREEVRRLLQSAGVKVAQTEVDGLRVLKCKLDEMNGELPLQTTLSATSLILLDPTGLLTVTKAVRFRVDFSRAPVGSGFLTTVTLVQEKGAMSSFKGESS